MPRCAKRYRVLLVDRPDRIPTPDGAALRRVGPFEIDHVAYDQDAMERLSRSRPDVMLVDWKVAEDKGLGLIRRARRLDREIPIILLTGEARAGLAAQAIAAGATSCLAKPLAPETLAARIARASKARRDVGDRTLRAQKKRPMISSAAAADCR